MLKDLKKTHCAVQPSAVRLYTVRKCISVRLRTYISCEKHYTKCYEQMTRLNSRAKAYCDITCSDHQSLL